MTFWYVLCFSRSHFKGFLCRFYTKGAFFWDYSGIGILGIDVICVLLGAIPFSEWTEYHSVHSAPDNRMNRMKGIQFTWNRQKFWREILRGRPRVCRHSSSQVTSAMGHSVFRRAFFSKLKFRVLLFLNWNKNNQNSPKRMHPKHHWREFYAGISL